MPNWLREPLLHFAVLGGLLFAVDHFLVGQADDPRNIVVGSAVTEEAKKLFRTSRGRDPNAEELQALTTLEACAQRRADVGRVGQQAVFFHDAQRLDEAENRMHVQKALMDFAAGAHRLKEARRRVAAHRQAGRRRRRR